jgi:hypothetical protein
MVSTNYIVGIAKILKEPQFKILNDNIYSTTCIGQLGHFNDINLSFWGNTAQDVIEQYKINDYILIEGYISLKETRIAIDSLESKKVLLTVLKTDLIY